MRYKTYLFEDDQEVIDKSLAEIKDKVTKIITSLRSGASPFDIQAAAKAVVYYSNKWGEPFDTEFSTQFLIIKDEQFIERWREEIARQEEIWMEQHPA